MLRTAAALVARSSCSSTLRLASRAPSTAFHVQRVIHAASSACNSPHRSFTSSPRLFIRSSPRDSASSAPSSGRPPVGDEEDAEEDYAQSVRHGFNHHKHTATDALGLTCRNPHYDSYLLSPSPFHPLDGGAGRVGRKGARAVTWGLIGVNVLVWLAWLHANSSSGADPSDPRGSSRLAAEKLAEKRWMYDNMTASVRNLQEGRWWTLVTNAFSHQSLLHLGMNMVGLNVFAPAVLLHIGYARFAVLYVGGAICCSLAHMLFSVRVAPQLGARPHLIQEDLLPEHLRLERAQNAAVLRQLQLRVNVAGVRATGVEQYFSYDNPSLGASGSIFALFGAYSRFYPRALLHVMFIPKGFPAGKLLPAVIVLEVVWSVLQPESRVAHWGHIGVRREEERRQPKWRERACDAHDPVLIFFCFVWSSLQGALFGLAYYYISLRHHRAPPRFTHPALPSRVYYRHLSRAPFPMAANEFIARQETLILGAPRSGGGGPTTPMTPMSPLRPRTAPSSSPSADLQALAEAFKPKPSSSASSSIASADRKVPKRPARGQTAAPWHQRKQPFSTWRNAGSKPAVKPAPIAKRLR
jgi:membrane associated rhomboid family serine protease